MNNINVQKKPDRTDSPSPMFSTGSVIDGKWVLIERIGKGGMGEVYRAHQLNLKRDVAIKVISADLLQDFEQAPEERTVAAERFQREVQTMASVRHPNILQIYDCGSLHLNAAGASTPLEYISMEYVPGNTFRFTLSEEGFDTETELLTDWIRRFYLPVLDGVESIHAHGIVHRDIKPENILMDGETPKIVDFGLARSPQMRAVSNSWDVKGTMAYMAPEQFEDFRKTGPEADIYALGKILFEAVAGKMDPKTVPFKSAGLPSTETPLLRELDALIRKATHEDKHQRFRSVAELRVAIIAVLDKVVDGAADTNTPRPLSHRHRVLILTTLLAVLGMAAYHLYGWFTTAGTPSDANTALEPRTATERSVEKGTLHGEFIAADGRTMVLVPASGDQPAFYSDRTPVTFHHYTEFLNQVAEKLSVSEGIVKMGDDILLYLGTGSEPHEQIIYEHDRFHLRDAAWAGRPVVRVTWLGARTYARHFGKAVPTLPQWRLLSSQPAIASGTTAPGARVSPARTDPHDQMMGGGQAQPALDPLTGKTLKPTQEWVGTIPGTPESATPSSVKVQSHVADPSDAAMRTGQKQPLLRYPWEGFSDVGFRTVLTPE